ncbi:MAG: transposase [Chloroflexi bacterium]|nr:transposase [Chloroflexota bacterium]
MARLPLWTRLLAWFSAQLYARLLPPADFLVKLAAHLEVVPLEQACADYHATCAAGAQATHTVPRLVRALLVKALFKLSLRSLEDAIRTNLVIKWFVGYAIFEPGPDHSTLARFEHWVIEHQHRTFFDVVLRQIDQDFPEERRQPQIGDTFALQAHAAKEGLVRLIRHTCQCRLRDLTVAAPIVAAAVTAQLDHTALFGAADERDEFYLDAEARRQRLQTTVAAALACAALVQSHLAAAALPPAQTQPVTDRLADLAKIVADEVAITRAAAGAITRGATLPANQQGSYRLGSATDPAATYRVHGPGKCELGYNVNVAVTTHFVREIQAAPGAQPDAVGLPDLLTAQQAHHGVTPA